MEALSKVSIKRGTRPAPGPHGGRCVECHGSPPTYRWTPYNLWEGAYGGAGERIGRGSREHEAFDRYLESAETHPLYKYFRDLGQTRTIEEGYSYNLNKKPNQKLGNLLSRLNQRRIARQLKNLPDFSTRKFAIARALLACSYPDFPFRNMLTLPDEEALPASPAYRNMVRALKRELTDRTERMIPFHKIPGDENPSHFPVKDYSKKSFLMPDFNILVGLGEALEGSTLSLSSLSMNPAGLTLTGDAGIGEWTLFCYYFDEIKSDPDFAPLKKALAGASGMFSRSACSSIPAGVRGAGPRKPPPSGLH